MKTIEPISIWDNGVLREVSVLNAYATNVVLNQSATFWYGLYDNPEAPLFSTVTQGSIQMPKEEYVLWEQDEFAWDWVAAKLNLVITGDYIPPAPPSPPVPSEPTTTSTTTTDVVNE